MLLALARERPSVLASLRIGSPCPSNTEISCGRRCVTTRTQHGLAEGRARLARATAAARQLHLVVRRHRFTAYSFTLGSALRTTACSSPPSIRHLAESEPCRNP